MTKAIVLLMGLLLLGGRESALEKIAKKHFGNNATLTIVEPPLKGNTGILYRVNGTRTGYGFEGKANGRGHQFAFVALFESNGTITDVQITQYLSQHGSEVCNPKWLKRFKGKPAAELAIGRNIDTISGATISSTGLVDQLQAIGKLIEAQRN